MEYGKAYLLNGTVSTKILQNNQYRSVGTQNKPIEIEEWKTIEKTRRLTRVQKLYMKTAKFDFVFVNAVFLLLYLFFYGCRDDRDACRIHNEDRMCRALQFQMPR